MNIAHDRLVVRWSPPPLSSVRAFEAAARHMSFTQAADELGVTQSAVSHGVRDLENRFGVTLFDRNGRRLALTDSGRVYLPYAAEALERLRAGDRAIERPKRRERVLTVSVSPSFAAKWLAPRLGAFAVAYPEVDLRVSANPAHVDFADGEIDVAIRHGDGSWPHLHCERLCEEDVFPVCSPMLQGAEALATPADLSSQVLIHHRDRSAWRAWLRHFGISPGKNVAHGPILNEMSLAIDAAVAGHGIALARTALVARDLREGRLLRPLVESVPAEFAYWIVCPPSHAQANNVAGFRAWLRDEAARDRQDADASAARPRGSDARRAGGG